jgi:hypothetical protein
MKQKFITALVLLIAFGFFFSTQFAHTAQATFFHHPKPSPTTTPVTGPVTGPITSPVGLFKISGHVKNHIIWLWRRGGERLMPAVGVKVKAVDIFGHQVAMTTTDANGNYTLTPGKAGFYKVTVKGGQAKYYLPPFHFVNDNKPEGKNNINFQGYIFKF